MRKILDTAAKTGFGMARAIAYQSREPEARVYPDRNWEYVFVGGNHEFLRNGVRNLDARTLFHFTAICVTPAMVNKVVGAGSQYMAAYVDAHGEYLDGGQTYKLHLPPNISINNFWSVTLYDPKTRSLLQNGMPKPSINSFDARNRTMMVLTISSLVRKHPLEKKRTGSRPFLARAGSLTFASMARWSRSSTRPGDPTIS